MGISKSCLLSSPINRIVFWANDKYEKSLSSCFTGTSLINQQRKNETSIVALCLDTSQFSIGESPVCVRKFSVQKCWLILTWRFPWEDVMSIFQFFHHHTIFVWFLDLCHILKWCRLFQLPIHLNAYCQCHCMWGM